jgi:Acyl CoA:acetate/3-ketoacid CoA transferase, alpha subunit
MISSYVEKTQIHAPVLSATELNHPQVHCRTYAVWRMRHPGFYTKTGVGTVIADGKEHKDFPTGPNGGPETYIMENGIFADLSIIKAWKADETGNLVFRKTARNFNPPAAMCGKVCVVEVEEIVPTGSLAPDAIHLPGIYVHRIIQGDHEKRIEQRTVREA